MMPRVFVIGLIVLLIGVGAIASAVLVKERVSRDVSWWPHTIVVKGGTSNSTYYHTSIHDEPSLLGNLSVHGAGIYFAVIADGVEELNTYVEQFYEFSIEDAGTSVQYYFVFDNTHSERDKTVFFNLTQEVTDPLYWRGLLLRLLGTVGFIILMPLGIIISIVGLKHKQRKAEKQSKSGLIS